MNINEIIHAYIVCMYQHYLISLLIIIISFFIIKYPVMQYNNIKSLPPPNTGLKSSIQGVPRLYRNTRIILKLGPTKVLKQTIGAGRGKGVTLLIIL